MFKLSFSLNTEEEFLAFVAAYSAARGINLNAASAPAVVAPAVSAPVPEAKAKPGPKPKKTTTEPQAEKPAEPPVEMPLAATTTVEAPEEPIELTVQTLTEVAIAKSTTHMPGIRAILSQYKVRKLVELDEADYPAVYKALCELGETAA